MGKEITNSASQNVDVWSQEGFKDTVCTEKPTLLEGPPRTSCQGQGPGAGQSLHPGCQMEDRLISPPSLLACSQQHQPGSHPSLPTHRSLKIGGISLSQKLGKGSCSQNQRTGTSWHRKVSIVCHKMGNLVA